jgi:hypothetical protein
LTSRITGNIVHVADRNQGSIASRGRRSLEPARKTVLNHGGRLPAKRIGKAYRITRAALDEFSGVAPSPVETVVRTRRVTASTIVDVDAISPEDSQRITTLIMAGLNTRRGESDFPRIDSLYDVAQGRLRLMITGSPSLTSDLLRTIDALAGEHGG